MGRPPLGPLAALATVQFSFATLAVVGKEALNLGLPPLALAGLRVLFASLLLAAIALARPHAGVPARDLWRMAGLGLLGVVFNMILFIEGLERTTAVNASILIVMIPVFTLLIALGLGRERADARRIAGILVALLGTLLLMRAERFSFADRLALGNLLIVLNCLSYSCYLVLSVNILRRYPSPVVVSWSFLFGALVMVPLGVPETVAAAGAGVFSTRVWLDVAWIVLVPSVAAYGLNNYALKRLPATTVASFVFLQPLFGVTLALWWLPGESLGTRTLASALMIFAGVFLVVRSERGPRDVAGPTRS